MINGIINSILWGTSGGASGDAPTVTGISVIESSGEYTLSYTYADTEGDLEDNLLPFATNVKFSGLAEEGQVLTGIHNYNQLNGLAESGTTYKWFRSDDTIGTGEIEIATTANYTLVTADVGKYIRRSVTPIATGGITGSTVYSSYSDVIAPLVIFNPFTDIAWNEAFDFKTTADLNNYGSGGDLVVGSGTPSYDGANSAVRFTRASTQFYNSTAIASHNIPDEIWIKFKTPASFAGNQTLMAMSNTHRIDYMVTGELRLSGTATGVILSANTFYSLRCYLNGASSIYELIGVVGSTAISLSTGGIGIPVVKVGADNIGSNVLDGHIRSLFILAGTLSAPDVTKMQTWITAY